MGRANTARKPETELSEAKRFLTALETGAIRAELIGSNARGDTLCLWVRSIVEGAALAVENDRRGTPRFRRGAREVLAQLRTSRKSVRPGCD